MAFKMLGISIQKLQLLGMITQHSIEHIPTLNIIGFIQVLKRWVHN